MTEQNIITREGLKELKLELKSLIEEARPKVIAEIKEAREQGDLSENAEFDAAREKQGQIEDRIAEIERIVEESKIISTSNAKSNQIRIGTHVVISQKGKEQEFTIVGALEADPFNEKISNVSPLGEAILGKTVGDEVVYMVETKKGIKKNTIKIIKIKK